MGGGRRELGGETTSVPRVCPVTCTPKRECRCLPYTRGTRVRRPESHVSGRSGGRTSRPCRPWVSERRDLGTSDSPSKTVRPRKEDSDTPSLRGPWERMEDHLRTLVTTRNRTPSEWSGDEVEVSREGTHRQRHGFRGKTIPVASTPNPGG